MRFLADESCDFAVVRALRSKGHDVKAIREDMPGVDDELISQLAISDDRILVTEDKDFGQIVYAASLRCPGVILIRFPGNRRRELASSVLKLLHKTGDEMRGRFVVMQPGRVRISERIGE